MIVVVDDEEVVVEVSQGSLEEAGFEVQGFTSSLKALAFLENVEPELVVSDLMMPEMDGYAFRAAYLRKFSDRNTPFLFLSSVADPDIIVEGLEQGAADYLVKPVDHRIFTAKVRSILKKVTGPENVFHGDLSEFPMSRIMRFCELKGISGSVDINGEGVSTTLTCRAGNFVLNDQSSDSQLDEVFDLNSGTFTIRIQPVDYSDLFHTKPSTPAPRITSPLSQERPMGKLSGIKVNQRMFQVQSEFVSQPTQQVLTMVILDGKVVLKRVIPAQLTLGREALQQMIEQQHASVEQEVQDKITSKIETKSTTETTQKERFNNLFEEGWDMYRNGEHAKALALWEDAQAINPADKTIETNLKIVRKKLDSLNL